MFILGAAGYWGYGQYQQRQQLETYLGNKYQQSFYEMVDHVEQLQVLLGKTLVSSSPRQNIMILNDIWSHATVAQQELTRLPISARNVSKTAKFLAQTGDYAHVMARNNAEGKAMTEENRKKLSELRQYAADTNQSLHTIGQQLFSGKINWVEIVRGARQQLASGNEPQKNPVGDGFDNITDELEKYPTLIYDGPFSDQIMEAEPRELTGSNVSREEARNRAKKVAETSGGRGTTVSEGTQVKSKIPSYNFEVKSDQHGNYSIDISTVGGHLVQMINNRSVDNQKLSLQDVVNRIKDFLASNGYPAMEPTYSEVKDNIAYVSLAYKPGKIIYYPDVINVQVALDNGQILGVEALSYLMSHHSRKKEEAGLTENEVRNLAEGSFDTIENIQLAVIPQSSLKEVLTYEVRGKVSGETYLIFYNAGSGDEEQILRVVEGNTGTFVL